MTKKTRYFMLGSAGVLVAGLCTGLVAYYGGFPTGAFSRAGGPAELRYVPADAAIVAYANVRDVMGSQFRQRLREVMPEQDKGRDEFMEKTGINIDTDVDYVLGYVVSDPGAGEGGGVVLVRGRFDEVRLQSLATSEGGVVGEYNGKKIITRAAKSDTGRDHQGVVAFMEPGLVAVGSDTLVKRTIDAAAANQSITSNPEIMALLTDTEGSGNAWAVGRFDVLTKNARLPENVASQLPAIKTFAASGHINGGVSGLFRAEARDEQSAENLRDVVRGFLALAKLQAGSKPELGAMLQSLELGGTGTTVALSFTVPAEVLDVIAKSKASIGQ
jgi:hypothetical protein